jgi:ABC-type multidrug transport system fused ATPase/permease subunit
LKTLKKIIDLLSPVEKKKAFLLFFLILMTAILETFSIASILPFVTVLSNPEFIETSAILNFFFQNSKVAGVTSVNQFLVLLGSIAFFFLILSLTLKISTIYAQTRFCYMLEYSISKKLIEGYLHQPYTWFLEKNSSDLGRNILTEVNKIIIFAVIPMANFIAQSAVLVSIVMLLFVVQPILTLIICLTLGLSFALIFYFSKNVLKRLGSEHLKQNAKRFAIVSEAFGAVKEIKVRQLENFYSQQFANPAKIYATNESFASLISLLPRYFIEGITFGGFIIMILIFLDNGIEFKNIIPLLTLYVVAGYRLLPSIQQIFFAISQIRFVSEHLESLHSNITKLKTENKIPNPKNIVGFKKLINLDNISFNYNSNQYSVLKNINLSIPASSTIGIIGATGSGKTTLIDIIVGLLEPSQGTMSVDKTIINNFNIKSWQKNIGYVPQNIYLSDSSIASNIAFGVCKDNINYQEVERAAKSASLHEFIMNELPEKYDTITGERGVKLSGGQCQRIGLARALYHKPQLLILDEATSALDNITEKKIMECIDNLKLNMTIIMIAHRLTTVKKCDIIFLLEDGAVKAKGTFETLKNSNLKFQNFTKEM